FQIFKQTVRSFVKLILGHWSQNLGRTGRMLLYCCPPEDIPVFASGRVRSKIDRCPQEEHDRRIKEQSPYATPQTGGRAMPIANIRGVHIHYQVLGEYGPWVALSPGGRRAL